MRCLASIFRMLLQMWQWMTLFWRSCNVFPHKSLQAKQTRPLNNIQWHLHLPSQWPKTVVSKNLEYPGIQNWTFSALSYSL